MTSIKALADSMNAVYSRDEKGAIVKVTMDQISNYFDIVEGDESNMCSSSANSLAESNSELSRPVLKSLTMPLTVPSPRLLSIAILGRHSPDNHCCTTRLLVMSSIGVGN
jgi:hypothetical protein